MLFARSAIAALPEDSLSPMIPEPTIASSRKAVPMNSATARRRIVTFNLQTDRYEIFSRRGCAATSRTLSQVIFQHNEGFPLIAVRIFDPGLVLYGIATIGLHFIACRQTGFGPLPPNRKNVFR